MTATHRPAPNVRIMLVRDSGPTGLCILGPSDVCSEVSDLAESDREIFAVLLLDSRGRVIGRHTVSIGTVNSTIVHPREVFKAAILANAVSLVCVHNHPSGDLTPSAEDLELTTRLVAAGELMGIAVHDHVIVGPGPDTFLSFKTKGLI